MKKLFFVLAMLAIFVSTLGLQVRRAQAAGTVTYERMSYVEGKGIVYIFLASGVGNKEVKEGTSIYIDGEFYDLFCWVASDKEHIVCNAQGGLTQFAKQTAIITLLGQTFYVTIPHGHARQVEDATPVCSDGQILGADVDVEDFGTLFVPGDTLAEVQSRAESWFEESDFEIVSGLYCNQEPS